MGLLGKKQAVDPALQAQQQAYIEQANVRAAFDKGVTALRIL
jgi:hypothetical protein